MRLTATTEQGKVRLYLGPWQSLLIISEMLLCKSARLISVAVPLMAILKALGIGGMPSFLNLAITEASALLLTYIISNALKNQLLHEVRMLQKENGGEG